MAISATAVTLKRKSRLLAVTFSDGQQFELPFEYLRVSSPSAEVRGHGKGQAVLQWGKQFVDITAIEPVGHYALKLVFSDGHNSGLYSWHYLHELGQHYQQRWNNYLQQLAEAGLPRDPDRQVLKL